MGTTLLMRVSQNWVKKQTDFCAFCMEVPLLFDGLKRYRCIDNVPMVKEENGDVVGAMFPVCCIYKYGYSSRARRRKDGNELYDNKIRIKAIKKYVDNFSVDDYIMSSMMIVRFKAQYQNVVVYIPTPKGMSRKKYSQYHLRDMIGFLKNFGIQYTDDITNVKVNENGLCVVVFDIFSTRERIEETIHNVMTCLKQYEPRILYISLLNEVELNGKPLYVTYDSLIN